MICASVSASSIWTSISANPISCCTEATSSSRFTTRKSARREALERWIRDGLQIWLTVEPDELILLKARKSYRAVGGSGPEGA